MTLPSDKYSVIIPVFNSARSLPELCDRIRSFFQQAGRDYEIIAVDDNSADESWKVLCDIREKDPENTTIIQLTENFGQHNATFCGLSYAAGNWIITIDDDLQHNPDDIEFLIQSAKGENSDIVYGYFTEKSHSALRNLGSKTLKRTLRNIKKNKEEGSSFRLFRKSLAEKMLTHHQKSIFIDELLFWYSGNVSFAQVTHHPRKYDKSGYSAKKLFGLTFNILFFSTSLPLRIMIWVGFIASIASFLFGIRFIYRKLAMDVPLGYTSLIVAIFFSTSILLLSLGIIGEYLKRIYEGQNKKMPYLIKKVLR